MTDDEVKEHGDAIKYTAEIVKERGVMKTVKEIIEKARKESWRRTQTDQQEQNSSNSQRIRRMCFEEGALNSWVEIRKWIDNGLKFTETSRLLSSIDSKILHYMTFLTKNLKEE